MRLSGHLAVETGATGAAGPAAAPSQIRVLIVEDHPLMREGMVAMLECGADLAVVAAVGSAEEGLSLAGELGTDVVLMDIRLPGMDGLEATREIIRRHPHTKVLVVTASDDDSRVMEAVRAGASGYLTKDCSIEALVDSVRAVHRGWFLVRSERLHRGLEDVRGLAPMGNGARTGLEEAELAPLPRLTGRELDVLRLVADGCCNKEIAAELGLAVVTVKKHVQSLIAKLDVADRTQCAVRALRTGLIHY